MRTKLAFFLLLSSALYAQTAAVTGRVTDSSSASVPGVTVLLRSSATGTQRQAMTNESGLYTITLLQPGTYDVRVTHQGFKPISQNGVSLDVDQRAQLNFSLEVGAVTEQIEVRAAVSRLNTVEASQG